MSKRVKKRFDLAIAGANAVTSQTFELDKSITAIHGVLFTSDRDDLMYYRGSQKLEINQEEIFPENYESKLLMTGLNVSPNERYYKINAMPPGNGKVKIEYKDSNDDRLPFAAYRVSIYLDCEI
ncbi:MAG TPA: hypothetical protein VGQ09_05920 [Chitinophagaceae bacterium]|jgi:hypothetical protein|nr:hypothetical protein [Chitinophagaceae bacterium]